MLSLQERYLSLAPLYYRGAHAAAVVYDITSPESFEKAKYWIGELQKNESSRPGTSHTQRFMVQEVLQHREGCDAEKVVAQRELKRAVKAA